MKQEGKLADIQAKTGAEMTKIQSQAELSRERNDLKEDLALLSLCDHHIITNSTYSWWGAYLSKSPNKKIICATNWLKGSSFMNGNHFPSSWINIDNKN